MTEPVIRFREAGKQYNGSYVLILLAHLLDHPR